MPGVGPRGFSGRCPGRITRALEDAQATFAGAKGDDERNLMRQNDIGLIGLAVMGQNLVMNMANKGFDVAVYNRTTETMNDFITGLGRRPQGVVEPGAAQRIHGFEQLAEFVNSLASPRRVMIMVKAGAPVDAVIEQLKPLLDPGDIIIDGGNADFVDTNRRHGSWRPRASASSARAFPAAKRAHSKGPASCRADIPKPGRS